MNPMLPLIAAVLIASLLGSFHCAGMCGAFVAIATGDANQGRRGHVRLQSAYHLGRFITYVALGAAAGEAGHLIDIAGALASLRPVAAIIAGATMAWFGVVLLLRSKGWTIARLKLPPAWLRVISSLHRVAMNRPPLARAAMIGLLTTLLPCGWLYAFVISAAGTAHLASGALVMAVFWAGTLPMLVAVGASTRLAMGPLAKKLPVLTAIVLIAASAATLVNRSALDPIALAHRAQARAVGNALPIAQQTPACCETHDARH